ncbi:MAG: MBL fold metallo-hydrolase [Flavobacteriales bacterium]|nr:MBL fold metallo-hydrolase [Flavobacteriales bacterium]
MKIAQFTFNPFSENTYVLYDETMECVIIDPGMTDEDEDDILFSFIRDEKLKPVKVLNTHSHIDHILGNASSCHEFGIELYAHQNELEVIARAGAASLMWGVPYRETPTPHHFINEGDQIKFGHTVLDVMFTPGHAPGHVVFIQHDEQVIIGGDVLFRGSVGRVDLPGCNAADLVQSIQQKLYKLADHYVVYPGHGPETTIGEEKENNMFVRADWSGL